MEKRQENPTSTSERSHLWIVYFITIRFLENLYKAANP